MSVKELLKTQIPRKYIYLGYMVVVFLAIITGSIYTIRMTSSVAQNKCQAEGGQWQPQTQECKKQ